MGQPNSCDLPYEIVTTLEAYGVDPDEYQLHEYVDVDALGKLVRSGEDVRVTFTVKDIRLLVTSRRVVVVPSPTAR